MNEDRHWMSHALALAERGLYSTTPNPRVGCVLVRKGVCVGEGFHVRAGGAHAEIMALLAAKDAAKGATAYVTLEPCSHFGRTPPCSDALIRAGVNRVVVAMQDPNPLVSGQGIARLRAAGIRVDSGVMANEAAMLNIGFIFRHQKGRPYLRSKIAASIDGRTALANGASRWITGEDARLDVHRWRARSCAILTGIGTVIQDNPELTVRHVATPRQPLCIIVDSTLRITPDHALTRFGTHLITVNDHVSFRPYEDKGVIVHVVESRDGRVSLESLIACMAQMELNEILVEAGSVLNGALLDMGLVDELIVYFAPSVLKNQARGMFDGNMLEELEGSNPFRFVESGLVGEDLKVILRRRSVQGLI
ncbi:MAG: bifunctional diaminohydroxyphosphoribosylaminopyrimidine deaminase/5-amino-6-(5-phosphoribosylamino)uracil reductase RibD [Proteobacteria bacterium]|nr:bifunctional diaminohydroxyphosphoribosylaminopyrimidine deaminase/5-amino-6-(5-phosphoribosylamino)uracil reductase RibD [Pseudomonadota bacterium]MDE3209055.1 bifunctional diaminohydroxyphosphoribosylaminopyrimidine deaminase/5-amino-6-(5-phosphoribosylamino)uracil reductase RibD [Pseudomonadota bacterium]